MSFKKGNQIDKYEFFLINSNRKLRTNEPYVFVSQAQQVYYVKDTKDHNWLVIVKTKSRNTCMMCMRKLRLETSILCLTILLLPNYYKQYNIRYLIVPAMIYKYLVLHPSN